MNAMVTPHSDGQHPSTIVADASDLRATLNAETPIMVLVDPMLGEPLPSDTRPGSEAEAQAMREAVWQRPVARIALAPRVPLAPYQHPYLVELQGINDPWLDASLEIAHGERIAAQADGLDGEGAAPHRIGGWLQSTMHLPQLAEHLSTLLRVNTEARTKATYLRLADRRVLGLLRHVAGDTRLAQQFGRLQKWGYLDACGQLAALKSPGEIAEPLRLDQDQWALMEAGENVNRTLALWLGEAQRRELAPFGAAPAHTVYAPIFRALANAREAAHKWPHRFQTSLDRLVWAALSLLDPAIEHSGAVHQLLKNTGSIDDPADPPETLRHLHHAITACLAELESTRSARASTQDHS